MLKNAIVYTSEQESKRAGEDLGRQIREQLSETPDVVILFAAPNYEHETLLAALKKTTETAVLVGCSSAGEFTNKALGQGSCSAIALRATNKEMRFVASLGTDIQEDRRQAAESISAKITEEDSKEYKFHAALMFADALAGYVEDLLEQLTRRVPEHYEFFGGGAGDNAQFAYTPVFYDTKVYSDAAVVLAIHSQLPIGVGYSHGWQPATDIMWVTEADGLHIKSIDGLPAVEAFKEHAQSTGQSFDTKDPIPFFLHNLIGIEGSGYKLRVPLAVQEDGSIFCAAEVPQNARIAIMRATSLSPAQAAESAVRQAMDRLYSARPSVALFFDCVATRLRMGQEFSTEIDTVERTLEGAAFVGCNTHGQIVRRPGQLSMFHNCTAVVAVLPTFEDEEVSVG